MAKTRDVDRAEEKFREFNSIKDSKYIEKVLENTFKDGSSAKIKLSSKSYYVREIMYRS